MWSVKLDDAMLDPAIYSHLRELAGRIHQERGGSATLQPTALVNEAWMKVQRHGGEFRDRKHFVAVACRAMRQILVDYARNRLAQKRGGALHRTTVEGIGISSEPVDFLALDAALEELARAKPRAAEVAQLRVFGGLTVAEVAGVMNIGTSTVDRTWRTARAFLGARLQG